MKYIYGGCSDGDSDGNSNNNFVTSRGSEISSET
jgi:hypothetical protein